MEDNVEEIDASGDATAQGIAEFSIFTWLLYFKSKLK